ncbi:hypothetical protein BaRGS_00003019 [Batillaria attramentaria]|uniref:Uncharacterized protein n=1 Tax=Batillaria attramentaria TaxID=370345 RepID=A0ABD0M239_9CAEN
MAALHKYLASPPGLRLRNTDTPHFSSPNTLYHLQPTPPLIPQSSQVSPTPTPSILNTRNQVTVNFPRHDYLPKYMCTCLDRLKAGVRQTKSELPIQRSASTVLPQFSAMADFITGQQGPTFTQARHRNYCETSHSSNLPPKQFDRGAERVK